MPTILAGQILRAGAFQPVMASEVATSETTTNTAFVALATVHGVAFTAPASGRVVITWAAMLYNSGANSTLCAPQVRTGAVVGSGTIAYAADTDDAVTNQGTSQIRFGASLMIQGLTPLAAYNVELLHRVTAGTGTFLRRVVTVIPD